MSKTKSLDGVTEYANRLIISEVVEEVVYEIPYRQVWKWHSPLPKPYGALIRKLDKMTAHNRNAFDAALPPEVFIPNRLCFATNFAIDFFIYTKFIDHNAWMKHECHVIQVATKDRMRVRKHAKSHNLPHMDLSMITPTAVSFKNKIASLYRA